MPERVLAFFEDRRQAQRAVEELKLAGFGEDSVSITGADHHFLDAILPRAEKHGEPIRVTVSGARQLEAAGILQRFGGHDEAAEDSSTNMAAADDTQVIELLAEEPFPELTPVQVGEVRLRKIVQTETRTFEVPVRREELVVERTPSVQHANDVSPGANGALIVREAAVQQAEADTSLDAVPHSTLLGADEEVLRVPLLEEQVVITLRPIVREEVLIRKRRVAEQQVHSIDLNHEVLQVDRDGEVEVQELKGDEQEQAEVG